MKDTPINEVLPASSLSVILGLYDRRKDVEARRLMTINRSSICSSLNRKHIRVSKVIVHQNFSTHTSDIALLKLGEEHSIEKLQRSNIQIYCCLSLNN